MKTTYIYKGLAVMLLSVTLTACMDGDWDAPDMTNPPYGNNAIVEDAGKQVTIEQLKTTYASAISNSSMAQITDDLQLKATVIGNDIGGNIYKQICVQDKTGALIVGINETGLFPFLSVGQQILINLKDLYIGGYGQQPQLGDVYDGSIGRMSGSKWEEHVKILPTHDVSLIDTIDFYGLAQSDMERYCGHLVCLKDVQIGDVGSKLAPGTNGYVHHSLNGASNIRLRTSTYANFAAKVIPAHPVTLYGIATRNGNKWQILIRDEEDIPGWDR